MPRKVRTARRRPRKVMRKRPARRVRRKRPTNNGNMISIPRSVTRQYKLLPDIMRTKIHYNAIFYVASGAASVNYFDVLVNSTTTPFGQTQNYSTIGTPVDGCPAASANSAEGLALLLNSDKGHFYQQYRVNAAKMQVKVTSAADADSGEIVIVPYKKYLSTSEVVNGSVYTARMAPMNVHRSFVQFKPCTLTKYVNVKKVFGLKTLNGDETFQAIAGGTPTTNLWLRVLFAKGDGAVLTGNLRFEVMMTQYIDLFGPVIGGLPESAS